MQGDGPRPTLHTAALGLVSNPPLSPLQKAQQTMVPRERGVSWGLRAAQKAAILSILAWAEMGKEGE